MKLNVIKRFCKEAGGLTILDAPTGGKQGFYPEYVPKEDKP